MTHKIILFLTLAAFWLLSSGQFSQLLLSLGLASVLLVMYLVQRMDRVDGEFHPLFFPIRLINYLCWLVKQLVLSNIAVVKCIWKGNESISPILTTVKLSQTTSLGKVIYANSITITPGTVTVDLVGDRLMVHGLQKESIDSLRGGEMDRRIKSLEG